LRLHCIVDAGRDRREFRPRLEVLAAPENVVVDVDQSAQAGRFSAEGEARCQTQANESGAVAPRPPRGWTTAAMQRNDRMTWKEMTGRPNTGLTEARTAAMLWPVGALEKIARVERQTADL
jgi:hypothetical protein